MGLFILRRLGVMLLTALCLTFVVFFLTNLYPNLEKLAKTQGNFRMSEEQVDTWLSARGYTDNTFVKYGRWLGVAPGWTGTTTEGKEIAQCYATETPVEDRPTYCGV
ncbi:MAG: ABC transporter permease, partial [Planctomycetota bacterium]